MLYELYAGLESGMQDLSLVPPVMESIIYKVTSRNPGARYQNVTEMIAAFNSASEVLLGEFEAGSIDAIVTNLRRRKAPGEDLARFERAIANWSADQSLLAAL